MRQMISGLVAAAAVMFVGAAPAMACGFNPCQPVAPVYSGCNTGCGGYGYGAYERLAEPTSQYYYVNQGPTYTGPGAFAPYPTYREDAVVAPANYGYGRGMATVMAIVPPPSKRRLPIPIAARTTVRIATAMARAPAICRARITATARATATPTATRRLRITVATACCAAITDL